ncbi:MAG: PspC domain-containing protein [Acidimicrobiia bacterium]
MTSLADRRLDLDLSRRNSDRVVAGVAGGIGDRLGVAAAYVRAAFVVAAALWGLGLFLYVVVWLATFDKVEDRAPAETEPHQRAGLGLMFVGAILAMRGFGWWPGDPLMLIAGTLAFGVAVLGDFDWVSRVFEPERARPSKLRVAVGVVLLLAGLAVFASSVSQVRTLGVVATAAIITIVGISLVFGPWLLSLGRALGSERRERIRQEERAEMAAHLHDSVLQTLALMQRTDDSKRMVTLARQQERELRSWLYGDRSTTSDHSLAPALEAAAARIEGDFTIPVDVVTVGDARYDNITHALVSAASEAIVNAAKHSGAPEVSVYAEVADGRADVWVADRGSGFKPESVPDDRRGLSHSILARLSRVGGGASVDTEPGEGTEVHLWVPISSDIPDSRSSR